MQFAIENAGTALEVQTLVVLRWASHILWSVFGMLQTMVSDKLVCLVGLKPSRTVHCRFSVRLSFHPLFSSTPCRYLCAIRRSNPNDSLLVRRFHRPLAYLSLQFKF